MIPFRRPSHLTTTALFAAALMTTLATGACSRGADDRPPEQGDQAVATVQDRTIWASDVKREAVAQGLIGEGEPLDATSDLFRRVLDEVIDQKLLAGEAQRRRLDSSPLAQRRLEATRERILGDMLVESVVDKAVSDQAVQTLYNEQLRLAKNAEEIRVRLILSRTKADADAVVGILGQGAGFEAVAMERSIDEATRFSGGDLGYSTLDVMPQAYADALRDKPAGAIVGPFQTDGGQTGGGQADGGQTGSGWAVLRVEDRRKENPPTLEQARPQIVRYLTYEGVRQLLEQLRGKAKVDIRLPASPTPPAAPAPALPAPSPAKPAA